IELLLEIGGGQGQVQLYATAQPGAGPVARLAVHRLHVVEYGQYRLLAVVFAKAQRAFRVAEGELDGAVQGVRGGDALLRDLAAEVDHAGDQPLDDEAGGVVDHFHGDTVGAECLTRLGDHIGGGRGVAYQEAALVQVGDAVKWQSAHGGQGQTRQGSGAVLAQGGDQEDRVGGGLPACSQGGTGAGQHLGYLVAQCLVITLQPVG